MAIAVGSFFGYGPSRADVVEQTGDDDARTAQTIGRMLRNIRTDAGDPAVQAAARRLAAVLPPGASDREKAELVFQWVKRNLRFVHDPPGVELLVEPSLMLRLPPGQRRGDCDDYVQLAAALLEALGVRSRIATIKADSAAPSRFSHVYLEVDADGETIPFDASHGPRLGWVAPRYFAKRTWGGDRMIHGLGETVSVDFPFVGGGSSGAAWWRPLLNLGVDVGRQIGGAYAQRVAVPEGGFFQRTAQGDTVIARGQPAPVAAAAAGGFVAPAIDFAGGSVQWIVGGIVLLAIFAMVKGNKK